jgi:ABC-2 type transport system ATP-binding protein
MEHPIDIERLEKAFYITPFGKRSMLQKISDYFTMKKQKIVVFDSLELKIKKGEIYGLLGPNGSGKTTLIRILSGTMLPDRGKAMINGFDVSDPGNKDNISGCVGVILGERSRSFYWRLTPRQNLEFYATLYDVDRKEQKDRADYLLDFVGLGKRKDDHLFSFSTGMLNRLAIARAFLHSPDILLLDEFMGNLDPKASFEIRNVVKSLAKKEGKTVLFTTHNSHEADFLSDRVGILHNGGIIAEGKASELKRKYGTKDISINITLDKPPKDRKKFLASLRRFKWVKGVSLEEYFVSMKTNDPAECFGSIDKVIKRNGAKMRDLEIVPPSLEDAFINIIEGSRRGS